MPQRVLLHIAVSLVGLTLVFAGVTGCGNSTGSPAAGDGGAAKPVRPEDRNGPASARDKRGKAPDDVISDRPGGPKPPGRAQPSP